MSRLHEIDPGIVVKTYDILNSDAKKSISRSSNIVSALTTSQLIPETILTNDYISKNEVPPYDERKREVKRKRQIEKDKTKGKNWYNLPATELTEEKKNDLLAIQMRGGLYADKFFKKGSDIKGLPKYFQTGTVIDSPADFYRRIPNKDRKKTILEELYSDAKVKKFSRKRYTEIKERNRRRIGATKHMKRLKKQKK
ncbi:unnamed protein product [Didymodactylos carnosus]|uniref:Fcf2 pre-rRNA processing C-terminal domain-containing protein n=1 Tax=Didymodactylos carnosus TaxID=1234261 RepID=A0A813ZNH5_9BILA|nr:unnamed protein product [Didymodactylos carnosus]CAF0900978.1 unnamed protein product [Didymodactylos carnosus]CAF3574494.1 unnamed protein product [Didymodactylos carnosus]CAF3683481.1 unnamed protein product [Didymodactylos carnosus]